MVRGVAAVLYFGLLAGCNQKPTPLPDRGEHKLLAEIPPADPKQYALILEGANWQNPYITAYANGVGIECRAVAFRKFVPVTMTETTLLQLPKSGWPYGRVVALQPTGLPGIGNEEKVRENFRQADEILSGWD